MAKKRKAKGLGDTIETITKATGIKKLVEIWMDGKDCGCDKRKEQLNNLFPYRVKANCFTEKQYKEWAAFQKERTIRLTAQQVDYVCVLYADIFNRTVWKPCASCSPKPLIDMIDKLDKVYNTYENYGKSWISSPYDPDYK
jgi:hypothetical protein